MFILPEFQREEINTRVLDWGQDLECKLPGMIGCDSGLAHVF